MLHLVLKIQPRYLCLWITTWSVPAYLLDLNSHHNNTGHLTVPHARCTLWNMLILWKRFVSLKCSFSFFKKVIYFWKGNQHEWYLCSRALLNQSIWRNHPEPADNPQILAYLPTICQTQLQWWFCSFAYLSLECKCHGR